MVSLLPPVSRLGLILGVTVAVAVVLGIVVHRRERLPQLARIVAPLTLLFFWALPFLPVIPEHLPLLLVLGGPVRWVMAALACLGCVLVAAGERRAAPSFPWPGARAVFVTSLVLFIALGVHTKRVRGVEGDEPHYLVIAHSLLVDGDLRIENNHQAGHYAAFYSAFLAPHFLQRGVNDVIYSIHSPGLPALVLPFYAVAGQWGAMALIALLASLAAVAVFRLTERLTTRPVATITWVAVAFMIPFAPQSWLVYPDMPAALGMAWAATWVLTPLPTRPWTWVWRGAVLGVLPWLHVRYSLLLAGITVCLLVRLWPRRRLAGGFLAPMAVSGALWLLSFYVMYGTPNPTMPYGYDGAGLDLSNIPRGVLGLLFDQEFGLLTYSPIYVMAGLGAWLMLRREETRWQTLGLLATGAAYLLTVTQVYMWWGGLSVPGRFLLPVLPLAAPMLAVAIHRCRGAGGRGVVGVLLLVSVGALAAAVYDPAAGLMFNERDGAARIVEAIQGTTGLTAALPTFVQPDWLVQLSGLSRWLLAGAIALGVASVVGRKPVTLRWAFWSGVTCLVCFGIVGSVLHARVSDDRQADWVRRGQSSLIRAYDGDRLHAFDYQRRRMLSDAGVLRLARAVPPLDDVQWFRGNLPVPKGMIAGPFVLASGRYTVRVNFSSAPSTEGEIWVVYHRGPGVLARHPVGSGTAGVMTIDLPITLDPVWIGTSTEAAAQAISAVEIVPEYVLPRSARPKPSTIRFAERIGDEAGRHAFHLDNHIYVEPGGFWVRGGRAASILVSPDGASGLFVTIQNGAETGPVTVEIAGCRERVTLDGWEERRFRIPLGGDEVLVPITITAANGFRPDMVDPASRDERWLGCFVRLSFE